jgi:hypothetical protein
MPHSTIDPNYTRLLAGAKLAGTVEAILEGHRDQVISDAQLWGHLQAAHRGYRHAIDPLDCPAAGGDQR